MDQFWSLKSKLGSRLIVFFFPPSSGSIFEAIPQENFCWVSESLTYESPQHFPRLLISQVEDDFLDVKDDLIR
jgi:hypothetical protein